MSLSYIAPRPARLSALLFPGLLLAVGCQGAIARVMGLSDVNSVGDINANSGPLAGIG